MTESLFARIAPAIEGNTRLREPQREAYAAIRDYYSREEKGREAGVVLPVGCGKSGLITLIPFAVQARRALVVAPGVHIASQLLADFNPTDPSMFYRKCAVLPDNEWPEPAELRGADTNRADLDEADVVVTNIQQLQAGEDSNTWLAELPSDFFDLIIFDEGHHNVATSWETLRKAFPLAKVVSMSATPTRADGQLMAGEIVYTYPIYRAVQQGFVKHLKGIVLNPASLRYVRHEDGEEVEVGLEEVRRLGEEDADFRRSIVSSKETLDTIVDASIQELDRLRNETGEPKLKIIASALNMEHCKQIVAAYCERDRRAAYVHSRENIKANDAVFTNLANHELDVIVQVRKLGEGFDHRYLSVAAVFSIFANLSPFVQFVGRTMRAMKEGAPGDPLNYGSVVFHAGANTVKAWDDFKQFAEADQEWLQLLTEEVPVPGEGSREIDPTDEMARRASGKEVEFKDRGPVTLEELPLLSDELLTGGLTDILSAGYTAEEIGDAAKQLENKRAARRGNHVGSPKKLEVIPVTKQARRRASRKALDETIRTKAANLVRSKGLNPEGRQLDKHHLGRSNWIVVKAAIDERADAAVGRMTNERSEFTQPEIDLIKERLDTIVETVQQELFDG